MKPIVAAMLAFAAAPALAQQAETLATEEFIRSAIQDVIADVEIGRMARSDPATPEAVQKVGQAVTDGAMGMNDGLSRLAAQNGVAVANQLEPQDRAVIQQLSKMQGDEFNRQYLQYVIGDLEGNIRLYRKAAEGDNPAVKQFAQDTLPRLESTLAIAREVWDQQVATQPGGAEAEEPVR